MNANALARVSLVIALAAPAMLRADAFDDLMKTKQAFLTAKSWRVEEHAANGRNLVVEYAAPDRYRIQPKPDTIDIVIGENVYTVRNGHATKLPFGGGMIKKAIESLSLSIDQDIKQSARDLGMQDLNGQTLHAYSFTTHDTPVTLYVSSDSLPVEALITDKGAGSTSIKYSKFNEAITITTE